jgi:flagellar P-ring protein precursor FlgI
MRRAALCLAMILAAGQAAAAEVKIKDLGHFLGWHENALVGYGVVIGLGGTGDSPRNEVSRQALMNVLSRLGVNVSSDQIQSRNVAAVVATATLPPAAHSGDKIDVTVSSVGDARSLAGGTLLMTALLGPDQKPYALAQGSLVVGGYRFDNHQNVEQKNFPTSGVLPGGATVETSVQADLLKNGKDLTFVLSQADFTTAQRIADRINDSMGLQLAQVQGADQVLIRVGAAGPDVYRTIARIEDIGVVPADLARVVINERSGTVVAGGDVQISSVVISQGDIKVSVTADNQVVQPVVAGGYAPNLRSLVVTNTRMDVSAANQDAVAKFPNTSVADLVEGLQRVHVDTRGVISVLQAMKAAGSLHAEIIIQ